MRNQLALLALLATVSGAATAGISVGVTTNADKATLETSDLMGTGTATTLGSNGYNMGYGVVLGYHTNLSTNVIAGVDLAYQSSIGDLGSTTTVGVGTSTGKIEDHKSLSVKIGYALQPSTVVYGRLGKGNADFKYSMTSGAKTNVNYDTTTAGFGVEHEFIKNVSVSGEYRNIYGTIYGNEVSSSGVEMGLKYRF